MLVWLLTMASNLFMVPTGVVATPKVTAGRILPGVTIGVHASQVAPIAPATIHLEAARPRSVAVAPSRGQSVIKDG